MNRENFLGAETRCDYRIDERMKKTWAVQMDLLEQFMGICDANGLTYFAIGGTLLGAVRHGGYIPWDDDIDVGMPRADYDRFARLAPALLEKPYFLQTTRSDIDYFRLFLRLRNSDTTGIADKRHTFRSNNGIFLDVFPMDSYGKQLKYRLHRKYTNFLQRCAEQKLRYDPKKEHSLKGRLLYPIAKRINYEAAYVKNQRRSGTLSKDMTDCVGQVYTSTLMYDIRKMVWRRADFEKTILLDFEYLKLPCPAGYDRMLKTMYGDYNAFPPVEQRGAHHNIVFDPDTPYKTYCKAHYGVVYDGGDRE